MDLERMLIDGSLEQAYRKHSTERKVAEALGIAYSRLIYFFTKKHPDILRLKWLQMPYHLNLEWLKQQASEDVNSKLRSEFAQLGSTAFKKKYHILGSLYRIKSFLEIAKGQRYYVSSYSREGYASKVNFEVMEIDSDFKYWFLGYFLGDGTLMVDKRTRVPYRASIYSGDKQLIESLYFYFGLEMSRVRGIEDSRSGRNPMYIFHTTDKRLLRLLQDFMFKANKSKLGWYGWELIPDLYRPAFLRGLYESDGSYSIQHNGKSRRLAWLGHPSYILAIAKYLNVPAYRNGSQYLAVLQNKESRRFILKMYPDKRLLGTLSCPSNLRKAHKAFAVLTGEEYV